MRYDFKKQLRSFGYAWQGIRSCVGKEQNLSFHLIAMAAVTLAGFVLGITRTEWTVVILCFGVVIAAELFNTAIERLVDLVSPERHPVAGQVKRHCRRSSAGVRCCGGNYRIDNLYTVSLKADVILPFSFYSRDTSAGRRRTRQVWRLHRRRGKAGTHLPGGKPLPDPLEVRFP